MNLSMIAILIYLSTKVTNINLLLSKDTSEIRNSANHKSHRLSYTSSVVNVLRSAPKALRVRATRYK